MVIPPVSAQTRDIYITTMLSQGENQLLVKMCGERDDHNLVFQLLRNKKWDAAVLEARKNPRLARELFKVVGFYDNRIDSRVTALHMAATMGAPTGVVQGLLSVHPGAPYHRDSYYGRIPLHVAVLSGACDIVSQLLKIDPKIAGQRDENGRIALHYACKEKKGGELSTRLLLRAYPEGAVVADEGGFLPLHVACRYSTSLSIIRMLIRAAPDSLVTKTKKGSTPIICGHSNKGGLGNEIVGILQRSLEESADLRNKISTGSKGDCNVVNDSFDLSNSSEQSRSL